METAILAVVALTGLGLWSDNWRLRRSAKLADAQRYLVQSSLDRSRVEAENEKEAAFTRGRDSVKSQRESAFGDHDKIPATPAKRFIPVGRLRAQAEAASLGPVTHDAKVRDNNARAMETV